jgi:predicted ABC-type transport system involved in lysophospholipase L1 biosynthesis ATPase subunit
MSDPLLSAKAVVKNYQALRPLRLQSFELTRGAVVALMGFDAQAAEMLIGLFTGAVLPDEGEIHLLGKATKDVGDSDAWLRMLDAVGIVTDRAVLIAQFSVEQNVALPFTLQIDPLAQDTRTRVAALAAEVGLQPEDLVRRVAEAAPEVVARVRLARALALDPIVLLAEHPSASLAREHVKAFAGDIARVARQRQLAVLAISADEAFATALGGQTLVHDAATGAVRPRSRWRSIFG